MTEEFTVAEAAAYLGISKEATHKAVRESRLKALPGTDPVRLARAAVEDFHQLKQDALVASLARNGETPTSVARKVREGLFRSGTGLPRSFDTRLAAMPSDHRALFSRAELTAACVRDGCRWCRALEYAAFLKARPVEYAPAYVELFGGQPCGVCGPGLLRPFFEALRARVHNGQERPSRGPVVASAAERAAAQQWASRRAVTASARPVQGDDGKAMVARRLKETRARLVAARRRGDQRYALQLAQTARGLEQDAARIERGRR